MLFTQPDVTEPWEENAKQASAQEVFEEGKRGTLPEVGHWFEGQAQKCTVGMALMDEYKRLEPR